MTTSESATSRLYTETLAVTRAEPLALSSQQFRSVPVLVEMIFDLFTAAAAITAAYYLAFSLHFSVQRREAAAMSIAASLFMVLLQHESGAYRGGGSLLQIRETERAIRIPVQAVLVLLTLSVGFDLPASRAALIIALLLAPLTQILQKHIFFLAVRILHAHGRGINRVVIYGAGDSGRRVVSALLHSLRFGLRPVAVINQHGTSKAYRIFELGYRKQQSVPTNHATLTPALLKSFRCTLLIVVPLNLSSEELEWAVTAAKRAGIEIAYLSGPELQQQWGESIDLDGLSLTSELEPRRCWHSTIAKRVVDLTVSSVLLLLLAPLLLIIAVLIRIDSPGPSLFVQERAGKNGELFKMYKLRSMHTSARQYDLSPTASLDPRITSMGRFLRRFSLDELPQLINVFLGEMSLVGPRPEMPFIVEGYNSDQRKRLQVIPGISGLWQLSADRAFPIHDSIQYDLYYIRNRGFFFDLAILIHTLFALRGGV